MCPFIWTKFIIMKVKEYICSTWVVGFLIIIVKKKKIVEKNV